MITMSDDVIDRLAGITAASATDVLRRRRGQARAQSQASYDALFVAADVTGVSRTERLALATFTAALHRADELTAHYRQLLADVAGADIAEVVADEGAGGAVAGPYGRYPATADLRSEDAPGPAFAVDPTTVGVLGARLAAAFEHTHLLVFRPREASPEALAALLAAGWTTAGVVTVSQLVAFLSYQARVVSGLRVLVASSAAASESAVA